MGLERLACVMQGVDNLFEVDTVRKILDTVCSIAGVKYGEDKNKDISIRVVTDHIRSATFMISDGVIPSNEGRGYVLRRILRRAARHAKLLGITHAFLSDLCEVVIEQNITAYPELGTKRDYIKKVIAMEEARFDATIDAGLDILNALTEKADAKGEKTIPGADVFKLYDTFGFPIDLVREIADERGYTLDEETFDKLLAEQKQRSRERRKNIGGWSESSKTLLADLPRTEFVGYTDTEADAKVVAILCENEAEECVSEGEFSLILDKTPFYGEGGGQVGDTGVVRTAHAEATVLDTKKTDGVYIHLCRMESGVLNKGETVHAAIDTVRRDAIKRNHSTAHLLQAALREVLGSHVEQAGSYVDAHRCRFDFTHFSAVTKEELARVEALVNAHILAGEPVVTTVTVRMVRMGDFSTELCGGTHLDNTAKAGLFKIISESSVAAGVRRIEGTTGLGVLELLRESEKLTADAAAELKSAPAEIAHRAAALQSEIKQLHRELDAANAKLSQNVLASLADSTVTVDGIELTAAKIDGNAQSARTLCDEIKANHPAAVAVIASVDDGKLNFAACAGADAVKRGVHAGKLVGAVAQITGGRGGGRPDSAMAGGADVSKAEEALAAARTILCDMLKK